MSAAAEQSRFPCRFCSKDYNLAQNTRAHEKKAHYDEFVEVEGNQLKTPAKRGRKITPVITATVISKRDKTQAKVVTARPVLQEDTEMRDFLVSSSENIGDLLMQYI